MEETNKKGGIRHVIYSGDQVTETTLIINPPTEKPNNNPHQIEKRDVQISYEQAAEELKRFDDYCEKDPSDYPNAYTHKRRAEIAIVLPVLEQAMKDNKTGTISCLEYTEWGVNQLDSESVIQGTANHFSIDITAEQEKKNNELAKDYAQFAQQLREPVHYEEEPISMKGKKELTLSYSSALKKLETLDKNFKDDPSDYPSTYTFDKRKEIAIVLPALKEAIDKGETGEISCLMYEKSYEIHVDSLIRGVAARFSVDIGAALQNRQNESAENYEYLANLLRKPERNYAVPSKPDELKK